MSDSNSSPATARPVRMMTVGSDPKLSVCSDSNLAGKFSEEDEAEEDISSNNLEKTVINKDNILDDQWINSIDNKVPCDECNKPIKGHWFTVSSITPRQFAPKDGVLKGSLRF